MVFHDRAEELADVGHVLASPRSELIVVYGRRGVGKTALLVEALGRQPHLYYQATTRLMPQQLEDLTAAFRAFLPDVVLPGVLPSFDALLDSLSRVANMRSDQPVVVVIDELPYLAQADSAVATILQRWWDGIRRQGVRNLKVFLLGSLMSWMEEQTLSGRGPLHNRRTGQIKLDPLQYGDAGLFYPGYGPYERVAAYAVWGGLPAYLEEVHPELGIWENVREGILRPGARLADEPSWLRFADLRHDALYASILRAIALGDHRPSKIALAIGRARADDIAFHLERLCDLRLVQRQVPVHQLRQPRSRQALYLLADHYVAFWYRFIDRQRHLLGLRRYDEVLGHIQTEFDQYISQHPFEDLCRQYLWRALRANRLPAPLSFDTVGSWWGATIKDQDEIDVVAMRDGRAVLVGECKWSHQAVDRSALDGLGAAMRKANADLNPIDRPWRALFARGGFSAGLVAHARDPEERVLLLGLDDLYW